MSTRQKRKEPLTDYEKGFDDGVRTRRIDADDILKESSKLLMVAAVCALTFFGKVDSQTFTYLVATYAGGTIGLQVPQNIRRERTTK